jgi:hypothetical protein
VSAVTARDEIRDASIARIAAIFPDGDLAYLLARLITAEAARDVAEADADRLVWSVLHHGGMTIDEALHLHDEAVALRERPQ